jgi:hypothetical protein
MVPNVLVLNLVTKRGEPHVGTSLEKVGLSQEMVPMAVMLKLLVRRGDPVVRIFLPPQGQLPEFPPFSRHQTVTLAVQK